MRFASRSHLDSSGWEAAHWLIIRTRHVRVRILSFEAFDMEPNCVGEIL
jgi:hypothetical protein